MTLRTSFNRSIRRDRHTFNRIRSLAKRQSRRIHIRAKRTTQASRRVTNMPEYHGRPLKHKGVRNVHTSLSAVKGLNLNRRPNRGLLNTTLASLRQYRNILVTQGGTRVLRLPTRRRVRQHIIRSYLFRHRIRHTTKDLKAVRAGRRQTTDLLSRQLELHMISQLIS